MQGNTIFTGRLGAEKKRNLAPLSWRLQNAFSFKYGYIRGWLMWQVAPVFSKITGFMSIYSCLSAIVTKTDGTRINYGTIGYRVVTTAFAEFMVDQLIAETSVWGDFKFHDSGVGVTAAVIGDTDIETTDAESRATGSQVESTSVIYESVGTIAYTTTKAITEHGLFSAATGVTLMDRTVFSAINVVNGDSIEFTYDLTVTAGG